MAFDIKAWLKQTSTIHGIGALAGMGAAFLSYYVTHDPKTAAMCAGSAFGVVCMAMNDNTGNKSSVEQLASDAITAIVSQRVGAMIPTLGADVVRVFQTSGPVFTPPAATVQVTPTPIAPPVASVTTTSAPPVVTTVTAPPNT